MQMLASDVVLTSLRILALGMVGVLTSAALFMLLTYVLRWAFPPRPEPENPVAETPPEC